MSSKTLKASYSGWLYALVMADLTFILFLLVPGLTPEASLTQLGTRLLASTLVPVVVLLLVNVPDNEYKNMFVYWREPGWLPGCQAFSKYAQEDRRIDKDELRKNVGEFPTDPTAQNARWYKMFKAVETLSEVESANREFLMYRDMATITLLLTPLVPLALYFANATPASQWVGAGLLFAEYALTALSANNRGKRLVRNVLAVHSARKVAF